MILMGGSRLPCLIYCSKPLLGWVCTIDRSSQDLGDLSVDDLSVDDPSVDDVSVDDLSARRVKFLWPTVDRDGVGDEEWRRGW